MTLQELQEKVAVEFVRQVGGTWEGARRAVDRYEELLKRQIEDRSMDLDDPTSIRMIAAFIAKY